MFSENHMVHVETLFVGEIEGLLMLQQVVHILTNAI